MTPTRRRRILACATFALTAIAGTANAQITGTSVSVPNSAPFRNGVAYDSVNQVYLLITQRPPVTGRFLNKNGVQLGSDFVISNETGYTAWVSIAAGGPSNDPCFLVTYVAADLSANPKNGRLIRYRAGAAPSIGAAIHIVDVQGEWIYSEKAQNFWDGQQFVVGTRIVPAGFSQPTPVVNHVDVNGNVSAPVILGDGLDYEGSPAISCSNSSVCLAVGFAAGIPTGYSGGSYARLFSATNLQPLSGMLSLNANSPNEDQGVAFDAKTGQFVTEWYQGGGLGYIVTRLVGTNGTMSTIDLTKGIGPGAGTNAVAYNAFTQTSLLMNKGPNGALTLMELGDNGYPVRPFNTVVFTNWDNQVQDYLPAVTANNATGQWLVTASLAAGGIAMLVQGTANSSVPAPPINPTITTGSTLAAGTVGTAYLQTLSATGGITPYTWSLVSGALPGGLSLSSGGQISGTPTAGGSFGFSAKVTGADTGFSQQSFSISIAVPPPPPNPPPTVGTRHGIDFDGDGKTDVSVFRPSGGIFYTIKSSTGSWAAYQLGQSGDVPVVGDYDGDGKCDPAIYRPSTGQWLIKTSSSNLATTLTFSLGITADIPVPGDYDGDGKTDPAVFRPSTGQWIILKSSSNFTTTTAITWGVSGDVPITGDYDGDGKTDLAVYRPSLGTWFILKSSSNYTASITANWGISTDIPLAGDFDGDGKTDIVLYRPSNGTWYILKSNAGFTTWMGIGWGLAGDVPVVGDFDGDGKTDVAIFRPANSAWWIAKSSTGYATWQVATWGIPSDILLMRFQ